MYDPNMPAPQPGQMQITGMPQQGGFAQPQGQRVPGMGGGGFGGGIPQMPQFGGMNPGGMGGFPQPMAPPGGGAMRTYGGMQPGMGGSGGMMPQLPGQFAGMIPPQMGNALGGVQNMPNIGPRPMHGENRGGMGGLNVQAFVDALRGWIGQRPEDMSGDARQGWMAQRPDFWSFMNQQQQQAASTPPMAAPTVI